MRRPLLIALLALGTVAGFTAGFAHLHHRHHDHGFRHHHDHGWCSPRPAPPLPASPPPTPP
jgi:hypothetical protein